MKRLILNNDKYPVQSVTPLFSEREEKNSVLIERYYIDNDSALRYNMKVFFDDLGWLFNIVPGHYTKLIIDNQLMMSDTPMERKSNRDVVERANGRVFIAGLGLGMIINSIMMKKEVTEIVVIEKNKDVIDLVSPKFENDKIKIIYADIFDYKTDEKFDIIYFDIWPEISTDNLPQMKTLHKKFSKNLNRSNEKCWMNSWLKEFLIERKKIEFKY